jgi:hypothetical protein
VHDSCLREPLCPLHTIAQKAPRTKGATTPRSPVKLVGMIVVSNVSSGGEPIRISGSDLDVVTVGDLLTILSSRTEHPVEELRLSCSGAPLMDMDKTLKELELHRGGRLDLHVVRKSTEVGGPRS